MWSHFDDAKLSRAASYITDCKRRARCSGECQPTLHCNSPATVAPDTTPVTVRQSQVPSGGNPEADVKNCKTGRRGRGRVSNCTVKESLYNIQVYTAQGIAGPTYVRVERSPCTSDILNLVGA